MTKYIINYTRDGDPISDWLFGEGDGWFQLVLRQGETDVSTENAISRIRLAIVRGELPLEDVEIQFEGQPVVVNEWGVILDWPEGFCDVTANLAEQILTTMMNKVYQKRGRDVSPEAPVS